MEPLEFRATFDLIKFLLIFLILFNTVLLLFFKNKTSKNRYAFVLMIISLIIFSNTYLFLFTSYNINNHSLAFSFFLGPTLFFYVSNTLKNKTPFQLFYFYHLILGAVILIFSLTTSIIIFKIRYFIYLSLFSFGIYLFSAIYLLANKKIISQKNGVPINKLHKKYLQTLTILLLITFIYFSFIIESFLLTPNLQFRIPVIATVIACIFLIIRRFVLSILKLYVFYKEKTEAQKIEKYRDSVLSKKESEELAIKLELLMIEKKPYLEEEINLKSLSLQLKTHSKNLSQVINENFNRNFFDYINSYRVNDAKAMLVNPIYKEYKIYEIMYEVGFNSRSSFNTAFKKLTNLTAGQYREQHFKR